MSQFKDLVQVSNALLAVLPDHWHDDATVNFRDVLSDINKSGRVNKTQETLNQCRLAFAGYVSAQSAIDMLDTLGSDK